jgi:hypothetical protein
LSSSFRHFRSARPKSFPFGSGCDCSTATCSQLGTTAFGWNFVTAKLVTRQVFLCNSPESVQFAFSTRIRALRQELGDGADSAARRQQLFITHGNHWRNRRRMVAPIIHIAVPSLRR